MYTKEEDDTNSIGKACVKTRGHNIQIYFQIRQ